MKVTLVGRFWNRSMISLLPMLHEGYTSRGLRNHSIISLLPMLHAMSATGLLLNQTNLLASIPRSTMMMSRAISGAIGRALEKTYQIEIQEIKPHYQSNHILWQTE